MQKRIQKIAIFLGIFIILVLCGGFFFIRSDAFLNWAEKRLAIELEYRLTDDYKASVGDIKGSILGNITINGITISKHDTPDTPVISTEKVVLKYNLLGLLTREFEVTQLTVTKPRLSAKSNADGSVNLEHIFRETTTQGPPKFALAIEHIECNNGIIDYIDTQRDIHIEITGVSIDAEGPLDTWNHKGYLRIDAGSLKFNGSETLIDTFEVDFQILATLSELDRLRLEFGNSSLEVTGHFPYGETVAPWDIVLDLLQLDVADVAQFFDEDTELEGIVKGRITASGNRDLAFATALSVETPTFSMTQSENGRQIALTDLKIDADFNLHPIPTFTLKTFNAQIADGTLTGSGNIGLQSRPEGDVIAQLRQLTTSAFNYTGQGKATDIKLIPLLSMFVQLPEFLVDSTGHLSGNATFNGSSTDPSTLHLNSKIEITETVLNTITLADSTLRCLIDAGELKVDGNLDETEINITGPFPLADQEALDLRMSGINFDDLMKIVNSADLGGTGEYTAKLSLDGTLAGSMKIPNASFNDIPLGILVGNLDYQEGQVFIENGLLTKNTINDRVTAYESRATIRGVVDVEGNFPAEFSIVAAPVYAQHYRRVLLGADYPVDGEARGELKLYGTLINLDGSADFSVTKGVAWGIHLDPLTLPLRIEDYNIDLPNCEITTRGQKVTLNVSVASNADYDLLLESDAPVSFQALASAANISDFPFGGQFDVRVVGTLKKPKNTDFQVKLDFSDITFLDNGRETHHPLGDASLHGTLVELKNVTGEPDRFDFTGSGFNGQIQGYVSMATDNPYKFIMESEALEVTPILRILHPALEAVTGTANGRAEIKGTVAALAPTDEENSRQPSTIGFHQQENRLAESDSSLNINRSIDTFDKAQVDSQKQRIYPYDVDITIDTSQLYYENSTGHKTPFTNAGHIQLSLKDDKWTIDALSLRTLEDESPFMELTGTYNAKGEVIDFEAKSDGFALAPFGAALGLPSAMLKVGSGRYTSTVTGTSKHPIVVLDWTIPTLDLKTEVGDIRISDAGGAIAYRDNLMRLEKTALKLLGNAVDISGEINVHPEEVNKSRLNLSVNAPDLALTTFSDLIAKASENGIKGEDLTGGALGVSIDITGTLAETVIAVNAQTAPQQPIRLMANVAPITLESLHATATLNSDALNVRSIAADGRIGDGSYTLQGDASFSTQDAEVAIDVSVSDLGIADFATVLSGEVPPFRGTVSGYANLSSKGHLRPNLGSHSTQPLRGVLPTISITGEVSALNFQGYGINCSNTAPLQFQSERGDLVVRLPLALKSPEMVTTANVNITGTFEAPEITAEWNGDINEMEWNGKVEYRDERITLAGIEIKNRAGTSTITGVIPFNLGFTGIDISDRFPDEPIDVHFRGSELPLEFFPGIDLLFSEADGTVDIDLALQGISSDPYITGSASLEAVQLQLKNFHEPIRNMKMKFSAREDTIDLTELRFDLGAGSCTLQQAQLALDGLTPKDFTLIGLKFELFPLGSTVQHALPPEVLEEVEGHLSTTLNELTIPFSSFLTKGENTAFPQIQKVPSLADIVAVANAKLSINSVRFAFKALDQPYNFQNPSSIQVMLKAGTITLPKAFTLENQYTFPVTQTFTAEDEKLEDVVGNVYTVEDAKTTLSIDAGSQWSVNGEFNTALRLKNFDVSAVTDLWPAPYRIVGALSGSLQISGTSENPKITLRRHQSEPAELYLHDIPIDLRWRIRYQNGKWEISKKRYVEATFGGNLLTFSWTMPYHLEITPFLVALQRSPEAVWHELLQTEMDGILDITVNDLDILRYLVPGLESPAGTSQVYVVLNGTMETPQVEGAVRFDGIGFELPEAGIHVKETTSRIALSEQGATVEQLEGVLNDGPFSMTGSVKAPPDGRVWENPPTMDLQTSISSALFEQPGKYQIQLGSNPTQLHLRGGFDDPSLTGNLNISQGYYEQNWEAVVDWFAGASVSEVDVILDYPILRDLYLDVDIDIPDNFDVRSSITGPTDIEISSSGGKLIGRIQKPVFNGTVSVLSGKIGLVPQTFEFIEGSRITNGSTSEFDPELNISLRTPDRIRGVLPRDQSTVDLEITASLTGTLTNPAFVLSAPNAPENLSHEEIMTFLIRNAAFSRAFWGFTFNFHRPHDEDARSVSAEYQLRKNMSIKIENNEKGEYGVGFEIKGRF
ncbi:MAG: hypothetical protein OXH00_13590 [Candidatus Poribacteria bacterium]|nr:hypothetical protein [Candidatus Poribacteria bacterium]